MNHTPPREKEHGYVYGAHTPTSPDRTPYSFFLNLSGYVVGVKEEDDPRNALPEPVGEDTRDRETGTLEAALQVSLDARLVDYNDVAERTHTLDPMDTPDPMDTR